MPLACIATGCTNTTTKKRLYRFPFHDKELLQRWLLNLRRQTLPTRLDKSYLCSDHFEPECFGRDLKAELLGKRPKPPLLKGSVPTLFSYNNFKSKAKRRVFSEQRRERKEKEEVLKELLGPHFYMKPVPLGKQVVTRESPMEDEDVDDKFSIQSLLPGFTRAYTNDTCTTDYQTRVCTDSNVTTGPEQTRTGSENIVSTSHKQARTGTENVVSTVHEQIRTGSENDASTGQEQAQKWVIVLLKCKEGALVNINTSCNRREKQSSTSETSCQTEENPTTETKPSLVSIGTQWDEDDFRPKPELIQRDHTYNKAKSLSK